MLLRIILYICYYQYDVLLINIRMLRVSLDTVLFPKISKRFLVLQQAYYLVCRSKEKAELFYTEVNLSYGKMSTQI